MAVNPATIAAYLGIYRKMVSIQRQWLSKEQQEEAKATNRGVLIFFGYILQYLVIMSATMIVTVANDSDPIENEVDRLASIMQTVSQISIMLMIYGISKSIKQTIDSEEEMKQEILIDDEGSVESIFEDEIINTSTSLSQEEKLMARELSKQHAKSVNMALNDE